MKRSEMKRSERSHAKEKAELHAHWVRETDARRALEVRLAREQRRTIAFGETMQAAASMISAGEVDEARLILCAGRRAFVNRLRDQVMHEPGGLAYAAVHGEAEKGSG